MAHDSRSRNIGVGFLCKWQIGADEGALSFVRCTALHNYRPERLPGLGSPAWTFRQDRLHWSGMAAGVTQHVWSL